MSKRKPRAAKARGWCVKDRDGRIEAHVWPLKRMSDAWKWHRKNHDRVSGGDTIVRVLVTELPKKRRSKR